MRNRLPDLPLPDQHGRTWLITGATNGLGRETARAAARAGARILLTSRDKDRGQQVAAALGDARVIALDFTDLASVRAGSATVDEPIDVLVNCAGGLTTSRSETVDGHESVLAMNVLGPFALTNLVADRLRGRVVIVGSNSHRQVHLDLEDLQLRRGWNPMKAYGRSKLADMLWALELGRRLEMTGVSVMLAHPGWALTNIQNRFGRGRMPRSRRCRRCGRSRRPMAPSRSCTPPPVRCRR
ncbi:SDR family NAD(P)-dependent oxidoreductase [Brachybacterium sillae]|uniref:SDR family NAD(P)-dependent oxidoreductase n=1 Tax=Brachybacterium sillae TaxID=2810536 RepID=UPI00217E08C4|nr:SDR family NAD(P)-dependent oxidoreductase [Brachybacterium sillae]